jgi:uncharacterized paraquat-inducible protein A
MEPSLADFVLWVLLGSFATVLLSALVSRTLHARQEARSLERRVICRICLHAFEAEPHSGTIDCPRCGERNEFGKNP